MMYICACVCVWMCVFNNANVNNSISLSREKKIIPLLYALPDAGVDRFGYSDGDTWRNALQQTS